MGFFGVCIGKSCTFATAIGRQKAVRRLDVPRVQRQITELSTSKQIYYD